MLSHSKKNVEHQGPPPIKKHTVVQLFYGVKKSLSLSLLSFMTQFKQLVLQRVFSIFHTRILKIYGT